MESMVYQGHRFLGGIKHFWLAMSVEDEPRSARPCMSKTDENVTKVTDFVRSDRRLTVRMISSVLRSLNDSEKGFVVPAHRWRTLGCYITTMLRYTAMSVKEFLAKKRYFSGSAATILA